jgi:hypothetical protein
MWARAHRPLNHSRQRKHRPPRSPKRAIR